MIHIVLFVTLLLLPVILAKKDIVKMPMASVLKTADLGQLTQLLQDLRPLVKNAKTIFQTALNVLMMALLLVSSVKLALI